LSEVQAFMGLCQFRISAQILVQGNCADRGAVRHVVPAWKLQHLDVDERFSIALTDVWDTPATTFYGGDITIGVTFKPWISPFPMERQFRFVATKQRDEKYYWSPQSLK
jgi:hypothetical protein